MPVEGAVRLSCLAEMQRRTQPLNQQALKAESFWSCLQTELEGPQHHQPWNTYVYIRRQWNKMADNYAHQHGHLINSS